MRFEIAATEYSAFSNLPKVVRRLLDESSRHVRIRHLLMDRGFSTAEIRHMLTGMGVSYLMPVKTDGRIEREVKATHGLRFRHIEWTTAYRRITDTTTLIIIESSEVVPKKSKSGSKSGSEQVFWLYVTNMPVTDGNIVDPCRYHDARWGDRDGLQDRRSRIHRHDNIAQRQHTHLLSPPLRHTQEHMDAPEGCADREGHG